MTTTHPLTHAIPDYLPIGAVVESRRGCVQDSQGGYFYATALQSYHRQLVAVVWSPNGARTQTDAAARTAQQVAVYDLDGYLIAVAKRQPESSFSLPQSVVTLAAQRRSAQGCGSCVKTHIVDELMAQTFAPGRTPRSTFYKSGVRAKLDNYINKAPIQCPAAPETAEFDAFFAGVDEGRSVILTMTQGAQA